MFCESIGKNIFEVSHKLMEKPHREVYFNHIHNHCEILLFIRGDAQYNIDGQIFSPSPYDMLFIPAATYHYLIPTSGAPYENYVIGISPAIIGEDHYKRLFSPPLMINIAEDERLMGFFKLLDLYHKEYAPEDFRRCAAAIVDELSVYLSYRKDSLTISHSNSHTRIDEIVKYIADNIESPLDADIISRKFLLSRSYVQNIFSENMHIGLKKYIMQKKIYAAHNDMQKGMSPGQVCEKYGFGDYSVFYRLYKKHFASAPRQFSQL